MTVFTAAGNKVLNWLLHGSTIRACLLWFPAGLSLLALPCAAQDKITPFEDTYRLDPLLYNGRVYSFFPAGDITGDQFLSGPGYRKGSILIRGRRFEGLDLNYDICNQLLLLQYRDRFGAAKVIVPSDAWLEGFTLGEMQFRVLPLSDTSRRIFRVIGDGPDFFLYHCSKKLELDTRAGRINRYFSDTETRRYLMSGGQIRKFTGNRDFIALLDPGKAESVKKYLRLHRIRVKKAADPVMTALILYCNSL